jgi:hypothetical protein
MGMLRSLLIGFGILSLAGAAIALALGALPSALMLGVWGIILLVGMLYERVHYKPVLEEKPKSAVRTDERFVDETTGKPVTVYIDPVTGERSYVQE